MPQLSESDIDQLRSLEGGMWRTSTRSDRDWMDRHLAPGFHEIGSSGRRWTREEIVGMQIDEIDCVVPLPDFEVRQISEDAALVTYRSVVAGRSSLRSSIWSRRDQQWFLEFHQGTPAADDGGL